MDLKIASRRCKWVALCSLLTCISNVRASDVEVGPGKAHATISSALSAASNGDRIVVFTGTYNERIAWTKAVDIVEAAGQTAVLRPSDTIPGDAPLFLVDITLSDPSTVTWDGIDLVNDSTKFSRFFMERGGNSGATVNIRNMSATDTPTAAGFGRVFSAETGSLVLENVFANMNSTAGSNPGYEIGVGAFGENVTIRATNCVFANAGGTVAHGENASAQLLFNNCVFNRKPGPTGFLCDLGDGTYTFNDCYFTAADSSIRGILTRGGSSPTILELNRCRFDPNVQWRAIQTEKATEMTCTNCCFPSSGNEGFFMLHNNAQLSAGDTSDFTFTQCTFSFTQNGNTSGIRDEAVSGSTVTYNVDNCLFSIPGSNSAHGAIHGNTQGGTVFVNAGTNYVFSETDPPSPGLLTGLIEPATAEDPKLSAIDYCHLIDGTSAAIDLAPDAGINDDIDKQARGASADFGCDEFVAGAPAAPQPPVRVLAFAGNGLVKLGWNPPATGSTAAAYNVFRTKPLPVTKLNSSPITGLDLVISPLQNGTEYCFTVRSVGILGLESGDSSEACATPAGGSGVHDLEVGPGKAFQTIQSAINAARGDGLDRVLVYTGDYDEALVINKQVDIVEAAGQNAVLRNITPLPPLSFVVELVGLGSYAVNWDGIDVQYDLVDGPRRMFLARFNNAGTVMNFKNMAVRDTELSGGPDMRFFSNELAGVMNLENVVVDLVADTPDYTMMLSSHVGSASITAKNSKFTAKIGGRFLYTELGKGVKLSADNCEFNNLGREAGGRIADLSDGTISLNDCVFKGEKATRGIVCSNGGKSQVLTLNRCKFDPAATWIPIELNKNLSATFTNCCIPHNSSGENPYSILINANLDQFGGPLTTLKLSQCTFGSTGDNPLNTAMRVMLSEGNSMELTLENNVFHIPGSTVGAIQSDPDPVLGEGSVDVIAGRNLRFLDGSDLASDDLLESDPAGVVISSDPGLQADLCHIEPPSGAINGGSNVGVNSDIDGETRPAAAGVDLGADEFSGTPAPPCKVSNVVCNAGEDIDISWSIDIDPAECRNTQIQIRNNATVLATVAGNVTSAKLHCADVPDSGNLTVAAKGPDGTEKSANCSYTCPQPIPPCGVSNVACSTENDAVRVTWGVAIDTPGCQCSQISIRSLDTGALIVSLPGNTVEATIACGDLPAASGSLAVVCVGPNGEEKQGSCSYSCGGGGSNFHRGDADNNGKLELTDAIRVLNYLFTGGIVPSCLDAADADDNGKLELTDAIRILGYLFLGGLPPAPPGPPPSACGSDAGAELGCVSYTRC